MKNLKLYSGFFALLWLLVSSHSGIAQVPKPQKFVINAPHSYIGFTVTFMGLSKVKGQFTNVRGNLNYDGKDITKASLNVTIKVESISTGNDRRDKDLRGKGFFDVENFPEITFVSEQIEKGSESYVATGKFTMRGIEKRLTIPFTLSEPHKKTHRATNAQLRINRFDYGITGTSQFIDADKIFVSKEVDIELNILWINTSFREKQLTTELVRLVAESGVQKAVERFNFLKENNEDEYNFGEQAIQAIGHKLIEENQVGAAIVFYQINVREFPGSYMVYWHLANAYEKIENIKKAIQSLEKSLGINPFFEPAKDMLNTLKDKK